MRRGSDVPAVRQDGWLIDQLRDAELSIAYLNAALAQGDQAAFMQALRSVTKARGARSQSATPALRSLIKMLDASGLQLTVVSKRPPRSKRARRAA
jgi:DNA-binding phage protein